MLSAGVPEQDCLLYTDLCFPPVTCCALPNFQEDILPPLHVTVYSLPDVKCRLTQMSNRREIECVEEDGAASSLPALMTSILHWKWHIDAFKLM